MCACRVSAQLFVIGDGLSMSGGCFHRILRDGQSRRRRDGGAAGVHAHDVMSGRRRFIRGRRSIRSLFCSSSCAMQWSSQTDFAGRYSSVFAHAPRRRLMTIGPRPFSSTVVLREGSRLTAYETQIKCYRSFRGEVQTSAVAPFKADVAPTTSAADTSWVVPCR